LRRLLVPLSVVAVVTRPAFLGATAGPPDLDELRLGRCFGRATASVAGAASLATISSRELQWRELQWMALRWR